MANLAQTSCRVLGPCLPYCGQWTPSLGTVGSCSDSPSSALPSPPLPLLGVVRCQKKKPVLSNMSSARAQGELKPVVSREERLRRFLWITLQVQRQKGGPAFVFVMGSARGKHLHE